MKRLLALFGVVGVLASVCVSQSVMAHGDIDPDQILICHATRNFERPNGIVFVSGRIIQIEHESLADHLVHGDVEVLQVFGAAGLDLGCPCTFSVLPSGQIVPGQVD